MRILVVEDEKDLNNIIRKRLEREGYFVDSCFDGESALEYISSASYDGVIMDIMMPKLNGMQVLRKMREKRDNTSVLLLTAKDTIEDKVKGLDLGADDYLVKPFVFDELLARVRVMVRRSHQNSTDIIIFKGVYIDCNKRYVKRDEREVTLSHKEFAILEYLIRNQGIVLSRSQIENHVWNYEFQGGSNVLDVHIRYLRKKIDDNFEEKLIHTVRGTGYVIK